MTPVTPARFDGHSILITAAGQGIGAAPPTAWRRKGPRSSSRTWTPSARPTRRRRYARRAAPPRPWPATWPTVRRWTRRWRTPSRPSAGSTSWSTTRTRRARTPSSSRTSRTSSGNATWTSPCPARSAAPAPPCRTWSPRARGAIVTIGSVNGEQDFGGHAYSAAKAGLASLTRTLAGHAGPRGVRVNLVAPGTIRTDAWAGRDAELARAAALYPLGRIGTPEDIASAVAFSPRPTRRGSRGRRCAWTAGIVAVNTGFRQAMAQEP